MAWGGSLEVPVAATPSAALGAVLTGRPFLPRPAATEGAPARGSADTSLDALPAGASAGASGAGALPRGPPATFDCVFAADGSRRRLALGPACLERPWSRRSRPRPDSGRSRGRAPARRSPRACLSARPPGTRLPGPRPKPPPGVYQSPHVWFPGPACPFVVVGVLPACPSLSPERLRGSARRQDRESVRRGVRRRDYRCSSYSRGARVPPGRREPGRGPYR